MADTLHVLKGTSTRPRATFSVDGVPTDLDAGVPTVTIAHDNGTTVASGTVTHVQPPGAPNVGAYEFGFTATSELARYTVTWTGTIGGLPQSITTRTEVVGGLLHTLAEARAYKVAGTAVLADATKYPNQDLLDARVEITDDFAERAEVAFAPRYERETLSGTGSARLIPRRALPHRVISVTSDGVAYTTTELADVGIAAGGVLVRKTLGRFAAGVENVTVEYAHGYQTVPPAIRRAALRRLVMLFVPSLGSTATGWTSPDGTTYSYETAGTVSRGGGMMRHYGVPEIDVALNEFGMRGIALA